MTERFSEGHFSEEILGAYHDNELDPVRRAEVRAHTESCEQCTEFLGRLRRLGRAAREPGLYYETPAYLESRIRAGLREQIPARAARASGSFWKWTALAACAVLAVGLFWSLAGSRTRSSGEKTIADAVVASHIRSLLAAHLFDVPSEDRHTVKPWFDGKIDFSPDVKDLAAKGFRLTGGRLDYLQNRAVAALVYQRRLHVINLFIWPSGGPATKAAVVPGQQGYNIVHWTAGGMTYWAVADIPASELQQFAQLYQN